MAAVGPPSDRSTEELLQNLTLDSDSQKPLQAPESTKKNKPLERSALPFHHDLTGPNMFYNPNGNPSSTYYYGGYDGSTVGEWDRYVLPDGAEMPPTMYGAYHHGYSYAPYGTYSPSGSNVGRDSQPYAPQQYPYPTAHVQPSSTNNRAYSWKQPNDAQSEVTPSIVSAELLLPGVTKGSQSHNSSGIINRTNISKPVRPSYQNSSLKSPDAYGWGGNISAAHHWMPSPVAHSSNLHSGTSQNLQHTPHLMGLQNQRVSSGLGGYMNQMYPNSNMYDQHGNTFRSNLGFRSGSYGVRSGPRDWMAIHNIDRSHSRSNVLSSDRNERVDGLSELNRGPRGKGMNDQKDSEPIMLGVKDHILNMKSNNNDDDDDDDSIALFPDRRRYNKDDFPETFSDAKFFVIKSYSEDDVHKSVKYNIWASTPNGNKKLDDAYKEAQQKLGRCPVFLLFSVNASGQFVGLAEMVGSVDFDKTVEYWQQDKWNGCFPVKWHIVKDVPNSLLRHITLENNENKPVTNSRDTQEVGLEQGIQMLKIFKGHSSKTCILDDFEFFEGRQKMMQEKKAKQLKLAGNVKPDVTVETDKAGSTVNGEVKVAPKEQRSFASVLTKGM